MSWPLFAIVGHPNKGKSSIVATLAEDEAVPISSQPGTTTNARPYRLQQNDEVLYELVDTPGFQRARELLAWLHEHERGAEARAAVVREFIEAHHKNPRFHDECQLLEPIVNGAGILYVVDGSRPYGRQYETEMEILRWTGQPRMALINLIADGDHVPEWRAALTQYFSIVRVFDAMQADFSKRIDLLRAFGAIDERWQAPLNRAADVLLDERARRRTRAATAIAELLENCLNAAVTVPLQGDQADPQTEDKARSTLRERIRKHERTAHQTIREIYRHAKLSTQDATPGFLTEDVFSERSFSVFGLSTAQLAMTGAASGAITGGVVDAALGGASLLLGAGIGAVLGSAGVITGANRLAKVKILGQPLGGYELRVGPVTDPNLPWVLLGRAVLHLKLVAERNHARREALVIDTEQEEHLADSINRDQRTRLNKVFRHLRHDHGLDAKRRATLVQEIEALIDTP